MVTPEYGTHPLDDARWVVESTGGGFSALYRAILRTADRSQDVGLMLTHGDGHAPGPNHVGPCDLWVDVAGVAVMHAECGSLADALALADRFRATECPLCHGMGHPHGGPECPECGR